MAKHRTSQISGRRKIEVDDVESAGAARTAPPRCEVLFADEACCVVNKPAGMFVQGGLFDEPSVVEHLANELSADEETFVPAYPLDMDVSGVLLLARTEAAAETFAEQFTARTLTVTYHAIVRGILLHDSGTFDNLLTSPKSGKVKVVAEHGARAITEWKVLDSFIGFALLECIPRTRVEQQIRAQLHHAEIPLAVDLVHGGADHLMLSSFKAGYRPSRRHKERPLIRRPSLHAATLAFEHPRSGETLGFEAPPPKDFRATLHQLARFGRISR